MAFERFFLTIFSAVAYFTLDIIEKNLISNRIPSANLLYYAVVSLQLVFLVGTLSAIQPMFVLAIALAVTYISPGFLREERSGGGMMSIAAVLVSAGTYPLALETQLTPCIC